MDTKRLNISALRVTVNVKSFVHEASEFPATALYFLLSHFQLRLQPIVSFAPLDSPALFVEFICTTANLVLKFRCGFHYYQS
jgi:hypothetical protein